MKLALQSLEVNISQQIADSKGIKLLSQELKQYQPFWQRSETLPKWDITITPV